MATVVNIQRMGSNALNVLMSDGSRNHPIKTHGEYYIASINIWGLKYIAEYGNEMLAVYSTGVKEIVYSVSGTDFYFAQGFSPITIVDTIAPGHAVTNPGATVNAGWQWHIDNNSGRGGVDWNYNFQTFTAPANGTVTHFNVAGVGMVVRLILDIPVARTSGQLVNDQYGPMTAIWFQHCSAAVDGHAVQGQVIGTSGDGYGDYGAHLHVHGMIDNSSNATSSNRCNFWGFL